MIEVVGWPGFEPGTNDLKGRCSTIELPTPRQGTSKMGFTFRRWQAVFGDYQSRH
jgi:hypothetical protein